MVEPLKKFAIPPDQSGYNFQDPTEILMVQLDGGAPKFRRDILNSNFRLNVQWTLDRDGFNYFRTFYNTIITRGCDPFLLDLYVDDANTLTEHRCNFIPGSTGLKSQSGHMFIVGGILDVHPIIRTLTDNVAAKNYQYDTLGIEQVNIYSAFGDLSDTNIDLFDNLMNVQIPADLA